MKFAKLSPSTAWLRGYRKVGFGPQGNSQLTDSISPGRKKLQRLNSGSKSTVTRFDKAPKERKELRVRLAELPLRIQVLSGPGCGRFCLVLPAEFV
jgi:hypothetical protein